MSAYGTGSNPDVQLNDVSNQALFMQVYPAYEVTWMTMVSPTTSGLDCDRDHTVTQTLRMSQDDIEAFVRILRFNNVEEFHVKRESLTV